jgi:hypothetical protein
MKALLRGFYLLPLLAGGCLGVGLFVVVWWWTMSGWAYLPTANPSSSATVWLYSDGIEFASVTANLYRQDVQNAIGGDGLYGFNIVTPTSLKNNVTHAITATVAGGSALISSGTSTSIYCGPQSAYYTYTEVANTNPAPNDPGHWTANGTVNSNYPGGSYIWNQTPSSWNSAYEVRTTLSLNTSGGIYQQYLRAQPSALSGAGGNTFLVEIQNPSFSNGGCSATLAAYEVVNGGASQLLGTTVACSQNMVVRSVVFDNTVSIMAGEQVYNLSTSIASGAGGYGA